PRLSTDSPATVHPFFFSSRRRHTRFSRDWSSDVCSSDLVMSVSPGGLLVTAPRGGVLLYPTWRSRVWEPAVRAAGLAAPEPTAHDLRHTYGTRLARAGVPAHEIMALMGHSSLRSVQRYLHAGPGRFDQARSAMAAFHTGHASNVRADLGGSLGSVGHGGDDSAGQSG